MSRGPWKVAFRSGQSKLNERSDPTGRSTFYVNAPRLPGPVMADAMSTTARSLTQPCPKCGHVYKRAGNANPDGTCRNAKACDRHLRLGY